MRPSPRLSTIRSVPCGVGGQLGGEPRPADRHYRASSMPSGGGGCPPFPRSLSWRSFPPHVCGEARAPGASNPKLLPASFVRT